MPPFVVSPYGPYTPTARTPLSCAALATCLNDSAAEHRSRLSAAEWPAASAPRKVASSSYFSAISTRPRVTPVSGSVRVMRIVFVLAGVAATTAALLMW